MSRVLAPVHRYTNTDAPHPSGDDLPVGYMMDCPGCEMSHIYWTVQTGQHPTWDFDGNLVAPTFSPSLRCRYGPADDEQCCHFHVRQGMIQYCDDCTHGLAGQTVPMVPVDGPGSVARTPQYQHGRG